ncbi:hypothetical protein Airi01_056620 [Actinoallomurus iriomotensis]|uniref:Uncharacterized protein n=1 Tax=Actinoallomurus iriomotensis TaxID=478107 RepID=A0A9W6RP61_9ACTN|nr:hypothetical protein Airi01_056620 [Actinoallomurus iriomotensis]
MRRWFLCGGGSCAAVVPVRRWFLCGGGCCAAVVPARRQSPPASGGSAHFHCQALEPPAKDQRAAGDNSRGDPGSHGAPPRRCRREGAVPPEREGGVPPEREGAVPLSVRARFP